MCLQENPKDWHEIEGGVKGPDKFFFLLIVPSDNNCHEFK